MLAAKEISDRVASSDAMTQGVTKPLTKDKAACGGAWLGPIQANPRLPSLEPQLTWCSVMARLRLLCCMLAAKETSDLVASSDAMTLWPLAAAASEK